MILSNEYLYENILERMPYFSLKLLYYDLKEWYSNIEELDEYKDTYIHLVNGEFTYNPEDNNIYSTMPITDMIYHNDRVYITNMDECEDFLTYCRLINSHPIVHPIYTRTLVLDKDNMPNGNYQLKYCRPSNIRLSNKAEQYDENDIESIKEIYPEFDLRYIYNTIMSFGFYTKTNAVCEYSYTTSNTEELDPYFIDNITNIYAFGPNNDNIGKSIILRHGILELY